jgi:hypothetical protein
MSEIWKDIEEFPKYQVSSLGRIRSLKFKESRFILSQLGKNGYYFVCFYIRGKPKVRDIHRLVALHFVPNPYNKGQVNHINGDKTDNRAENLEWLTPSENQQHSIRTGLRNDRGEASVNSKLTEAQVLDMRKMYQEEDITYLDLSKRFSVHRDYVGLVIRKERWAHI